jgi:hypothetical protein
VDDCVTYTCTLDMRRATVAFLAGLLEAERIRRGTRADTRALTCFAQAVLVVRWFLDSVRLARLATDHEIGRSTAYRYLHEGIDALAAQAPDLHAALTYAQQAGIRHLNLDGVVIPTDRCKAPGPTKEVDLWWPGKIHGARRQRPGPDPAGRLAAVDQPGAPWPRTRRDRRRHPRPDRTARRARPRRAAHPR